MRREEHEPLEETWEKDAYRVKTRAPHFAKEPHKLLRQLSQFLASSCRDAPTKASVDRPGPLRKRQGRLFRTNSVEGGQIVNKFVEATLSIVSDGSKIHGVDTQQKSCQTIRSIKKRFSKEGARPRAITKRREQQRSGRQQSRPQTTYKCGRGPAKPPSTILQARSSNRNRADQHINTAGATELSEKRAQQLKGQRNRRDKETTQKKKQ